MNAIPTIKARTEKAIQTLNLIGAAAKSAAEDYDGLLQKEAILAAIDSAAAEALEELYWVTVADAAAAPAPTDDEREAAARRR